MSTKKDTKHDTKASKHDEPAVSDSPKSEPVKATALPEPDEKAWKNKSKPAALFAGVANHALGGVNDLKFRGTVAECRDYFGEHVDSFRGSAPHGGNTWGQIVDAGTLELIDSTVSSVNEWEAKGWATA